MKKTVKNDLILVFGFLLIAFAVWGALKLTQKPGEYAVIEIDGAEYARFPLDADMKLEIPTDGGHVNTLVIENGKAYIASADCPEQLCVRQRPISLAGQTIVCLPHRLVLRIEGESGVDAVQ